MSNDYAKWIGGGLGWMYGGPLGALIGYQLGKYIGKKSQSKETSFEMSLLILSSMIIEADGKIKKDRDLNEGAKNNKSENQKSKKKKKYYFFPRNKK